MQLIPKGTKRNPDGSVKDPKEMFHVPTGVGKALILTGVVEEYIEPIKPEQPTRWMVVNGGVAGEYPPILKASCPVCRNEGTCESAVGTAHKTLVLRHHTGPETCPDEVAEQYVAAFRRWLELYRPKQLKAFSEQQEAIRNHAVVWR